MKKGEKAFKYADLLWDDEKLRRITLEDMCRSWNIACYSKRENSLLG
jgi:hypothetical protein